MNKTNNSRHQDNRQGAILRKDRGASWIDGFARTLASESANKNNRRDFLRGLFAAATGVPALAPAQDAPIAPTGESGDIWLPVVQGPAGNSPLCPVASTCNNRQYCSSGNACRCLMSAEGIIRCGQIPGCDVPKCTTSADCAHLGEGYFCDTPYSGCCSDGELARCIAPCDDNLATCPEDRRCGYNCCAADEICIDGRCVSGEIGPVTGTWEGNLTYGDERVDLRFVMQNVGNNLVAQMWYVDPVTRELVTAGDFEGTAQNGSILARSNSNTVLRGEYTTDANTLEGTYQMGGEGDDSVRSLTADVVLTRSTAAAAEIEFGVSYY